MGFETITSAVELQCSTYCAIPIHWEQVKFLSLLLVCFTFFSKRYGILGRRA